MENLVCANSFRDLVFYKKAHKEPISEYFTDNW